MNCAGSVALIGDEPSVGGIEAMRGTAAHRLVEIMIADGDTDASVHAGMFVLVQQAGEQESELTRIGDPRVLNPPSGWFVFEADDVMISGVQTMIDEVERVKDTLWEPEVYSERFLDMSWLDARLGGTADVTLVEPAGWIHLFDYKNGRIVVEIKDNEQLKNYGVGLLHEHPDCVGVHCHIIQPNSSHEDGVIRDESYSADELKLFELQLKAAADATSAPNAPLRAGGWCTYCPAKIRCPAFDAFALEQAGFDFADDPIEPPPVGHNEMIAIEQGLPGAADAYLTELARRARWIPLIDSWARDLRTRIMQELMNGQPVPGWKLVRGRSNRKWPDVPQRGIEDVLVEQGDLSVSTLYTEPELKSPAQVEKLGIGKEHKAKVKALVAQLAIKPEGKLAIAIDADARPPVSPGTLAADDFAQDPIEDEQT